MRTPFNASTSTPIVPADWARKEFGHAQLGDERRTQRLTMIATAFAQQPTAPIPQAMPDSAGAKAAYRFFDTDDMPASAIRQAHQQATLQRVQNHCVILAVQDTTTLNYSTHPQTKGLGSIGSHSPKTVGLILHSTLAITPTGVPLGFVHTSVRARQTARGQAAQRHQRKLADKESVKWVDSLTACQELAAASPQTKWINVGDREGDLYELVAQAKAPTEGPSVGLLVRSRHNRKLADQTKGLWEKVHAQPVAAQLEVSVGRREQQPSRLATVSIRFAEVTLNPPRRQACLGPLQVWVIEVREARAPKGVEPILWRLVTTVPVTSAEEAITCVRWYAQRWQIEVIHRVLKSGCRIEQRQLETAQRLERALAVDQVVAWRILALCKAAREQPNASVRDWLSQAEWEALWCQVHRRVDPPKTPPTIREAVRWIARLGGFLGRRGDGEPGPTTLWRGFHRLTDITAMYELCHRKKRRTKCG